MPGLRTIYDWRDQDPKFAARLARAREAGYDIIAADCLRIADDDSGDEIETEQGGTKFNQEFAARSKIRIETRLKLLKCWDPSRYGDKVEFKDTTPKPQLTREEQLAQLRDSGLRIADVFASLTKKAAPTAGELIEIGDGAEPGNQGEEEDLSGLDDGPQSQQQNGRESQ
jgi:hypothetical protein